MSEQSVLHQPQPEEKTPEEIIDNLKAHLGLAVQIFRATVLSAEIDPDATELKIGIGDQPVAKSTLSQLFDKWEALAK